MSEIKKNMQAIDGNTAAAHAAYAFSEVAAIYPITPSTTMGELAEQWSAQGRKNIFGEKLNVIEMQSEGGAAGAVHGSLSAGALTTTFTASQGLMLMLPNMHKIAGELLPAVFHVSARSLACQSLSIFGDHSDVMSARNTGFAMLASSSVQEVMDLAIVCHLAALEASIPFLHFFDGFRTSNEIQKAELIPYETMAAMLDMKFIEKFRARCLTPDRPYAKVGAENPDVYFQGRETANSYYNAVPGIVKKCMDKVGKKIGREYKLFEYSGAPDADKIIIAMGSGCDTIEETVEYLNKRGEKAGALKVHLYRPFSVRDFTEAIPKSVKKIAVLDRTKEPGAIGEPLYLDSVAALCGRDIKIIGGRYGLSSKEFTPGMVKAVYDHLDKNGHHGFTVGIRDDVTNLSIPVEENIIAEPSSTIKCKFWGYGSDGTVGACKNAIKIIGDNTDMNAQGYFVYDSKKSGGITISYLRFGKEKIRAPYLPIEFDFVALHKPEYIGRYDILDGIKKDGIFLVNSPEKSGEVFASLTEKMQKTLRENDIKLYAIDALKIAEEVGLGLRINTVMLAAFFKISGVLPEKQAIELLKKAIKKIYGLKGDKVVTMNWAAVDKTAEALVKLDIPSSAGSAQNKKLMPDNASSFEKNIIETIMRLKGNDIPVSLMTNDGSAPTATTRLEKRGVAPMVPRWLSDKCIQCNQCAFICPHSAVRAKQIAPEELKNAPAGFKTVESKTKNDRNLQYRLQIYAEDCTGCGNCVNTCPVQALEFRPIEEERAAGSSAKTEFFDNLPDDVTDGVKETSVKGSQFRRPLFEFPGACAGCGESAYIKNVTQLFGKRMIIANATGCSSIYGGTFPTIPYCQTKDGAGPCWANSLFEDNAEYSFGMKLAVEANRQQLLSNVTKLIEKNISPELTQALKKNVELWKNVDAEAKAAATASKTILKDALERACDGDKKLIRKAIELQDYFVDKSVWCIGGDGWAYDIGYGGLDHVLASKKNINVLVLDTEVYSNTGGQSSKATQLGASAKFAISGKEIKKKDLGLIAMSYGYVYVASCSLGANKQQFLNAISEAEAYDGPALIICYSPCINHGLDMSKSVEEEKLAVECGYWPLYRFNPALDDEGKNPFKLESKEPNGKFQEFIQSEVRFSSVKKLFPDRAEELFAKAEKAMLKRYAHYKKLAE